MNETDAFIVESMEHSGVKGMKWGVRRTNRSARKDAQEFARAKQFFGEGAGTRRKLIKAQVEGKSKNNPAYAKAFQEHLSKQDTSKHASKAVSERRRKDVAKSTKQTTGAVARRLTGEMGTKAAFVALVAGGIAFASSPKGQRIMNQTVSKIKNAQASRRGIKLVNDFLK